MLSTNESKGLALARGFIVLIMPAVHTTLLYSTPEVKQGVLGFFLGFLAEQPGAQLFMFLMGVFIAYGRKKSFTQTIQRTIYLLAAGYLLNFIRLVLPYWWGWLPEEFLAGNKVVIDDFTGLHLLLTGDILQLAAIAYPVCQLLLRVKQKIFVFSFTILLTVLLSPLLWKVESNHLLLQLPLRLFNGVPPATFFPAFPWLCYPLAGVLAGLAWQKCLQFARNKAWLISSALVVITGIMLRLFEPSEWNNNFYRLGIGGTFFHLGVVMLWIALFVWLATKFEDNIFFRFLRWISVHITSIYFIQWILIMWLLPVFGYEQLPLNETLCTILLTSMISFLLPALYNELIRSRKLHSNE
ncbi:MAG: hypothetical protein GXC73_17135 [Chitinophagaceae bacterium]|nr:hypothetical protein [Chitinophagaceae bacterium]